MSKLFEKKIEELFSMSDEEVLATATPEELKYAGLMKKFVDSLIREHTLRELLKEHDDYQQELALSGFGDYSNTVLAAKTAAALNIRTKK